MWIHGQERKKVRRGGLTLNEPSSPDRIIQTDLISPQQAKTLKRLPFWGNYFTTARQMMVSSIKICNLWMENEWCSLFIFWGETKWRNQCLLLPHIRTHFDKWFHVSLFTDTLLALSVCWPFLCLSGCWVQRRGPLMWGAQRVARKPRGGCFQHAFNGVATLHATHSATAEKAY